MKYVLLTLSFAFSLSSMANVPHTFTAGQKIEASKINDNFNYNNRKVSYVTVRTTDHYHQSISDSTSYVTFPLVSVKGNTTVISVDDIDDTITFNESGKYELSIPVGSYNGASWVSLAVIDGDTNQMIEEHLEVAYSQTTVVAFNTVFTSLQMESGKKIKIRLKSSNNATSGSMYLGRIKIVKTH